MKPPVDRKRGREVGNESGIARRSKRPKLTRSNLRLHDKLTRLLERSSKFIISPSQPGIALDEGSFSSKHTVLTTTSGFDMIAADNGIQSIADSSRPTNYADLKEMLDQPRRSESPNESDYEFYMEKLGQMRSEQDVVVESSIHLFKDHRQRDYARHYNTTFTGLPKDCGFNRGLLAPQPDYVESLVPEAYRPFPIARELGGAAVLIQRDRQSVTLPHFIGEWKCPAGSMPQAKSQAAYDGATCVHGRNHALEYMGKRDPEGHAAVTSFVCNGEQLSIFAHHALPSLSTHGKVEYHQSMLSNTPLNGSLESYKQGRKHLRNAQDYGKQQSAEMRDRLKSHWAARTAQRALASQKSGRTTTTTPKEDGMEGREEVSRGRTKTPKAAFSATHPTHAQPPGNSGRLTVVMGEEYGINSFVGDYYVEEGCGRFSQQDVHGLTSTVAILITGAEDCKTKAKTASCTKLAQAQTDAAVTVNMRMSNSSSPVFLGSGTVRKTESLPDGVVTQEAPHFPQAQLPSMKNGSPRNTQLVASSMDGEAWNASATEYSAVWEGDENDEARPRTRPQDPNPERNWHNGDYGGVSEK